MQVAAGIQRLRGQVRSQDGLEAGDQGSRAIHILLGVAHIACESVL